ncbi:MAG TPA: YrdB family protein [Pedococcus sp.]|nr:YrdB family protein [Nocardioidaceae bacterium]HEX5428850.1 YrdB family protein [Pedococcus sp.]
MGALLAVRFLAELGLLVAFGWGGWFLVDPLAIAIVLAVGLPALAAFVWGRWLAPRATGRLPDPARLGVEMTLFALALLLVAGAHPRPHSVVFGLVVFVAFLVSLPARHAKV